MPVRLSGAVPYRTRLPVATSVRQRTIALVGVPVWRYGPRVTEAPVDPESSRSKLRSELVPLAWWTSTARTFVPATREDAGTLAVTNVDSAGAPRAEDAGVV